MGWLGGRMRHTPDGPANPELIRAALKHAERQPRRKKITEGFVRAFFRAVDTFAQTGLGGPYDKNSNSSDRE